MKRREYRRKWVVETKEEEEINEFPTVEVVTAEWKSFRVFPCDICHDGCVVFGKKEKFWSPIAHNCACKKELLKKVLWIDRNMKLL